MPRTNGTPPAAGPMKPKRASAATSPTSPSSPPLTSGSGGGSTATAVVVAVFAVFAGLFALSYPVLRTGHVLPAPLSPPSAPYLLNLDSSCRRLRPDLGLACEDLALHPTLGIVYAACDSVVARRNYFVPLKWLDDRAAGSGGIYVVDLATEELTKLELDGPALSTHGLSIHVDPADASRVRLFLINHRPAPGNSTVEVYEHEVGQPAVRHLFTADPGPPLFRDLNSVAAVGPAAFYASSSRRFPGQPVLEVMLARPWGKVVFWDAEAGVGRVVAEDLSYVNGVAVSRDGHSVYVAETLTGRIFVYERRRNNALALKERIQMDHSMDNIFVEPESGDLYLAGLPTLLDGLTLAGGKPDKVASAVSKITRASGEAVFMGHEHKGTYLTNIPAEVVSGATTALVSRQFGKTLFGKVCDADIIVCDGAL
ncbi:Serum paraoxonase/arylesterase 1 [Cladochytrium tenue]|nr:Serum paraoxonase/arylesterase 1 [Cladochytrium tenue]